MLRTDSPSLILHSPSLNRSHMTGDSGTLSCSATFFASSRFEFPVCVEREREEEGDKENDSSKGIQEGKCHAGR